MTTSDTPETDDQPIVYAMNDNGYQVPCVDLEFARRLERERDEAREELKHITEYGTEEINAAVELRQKLASNRPTPETDAAWACFKGHTELLHDVKNLSRKLERERDEAREAAAKWESSSDAMERAGAEQARRADENREWALKAERERDEAREQVKELIYIASRAISLAEIDVENDKFGIVSELRYELKQIMQEGAK